MTRINVDDWVLDNNIDLPLRSVNNSAWNVRDYTAVFEDIFNTYPRGLTLELQSGKTYGYNKTLVHGDGVGGRFRIIGNLPSTNYGPYPVLIAIPDENGEFGDGMENVSLPGNASLGMPSFDENSNGGRVPGLPEGVTAGIWSVAGNMSISNIHFMSAPEIRQSKPHVYLWMIRYSNQGNTEDTDPSVISSAFSPNWSIDKTNDDWATAVYHEGRGLKVKNSAFNNKRTGITQSFPKNVYDATPQDDDNQHWNGGNRKAEFTGNHIHGAKSRFLHFTGDYALNRGSIISNNQLDIGGTLMTVDGKGMTNSIISNNVVANSTTNSHGSNDSVLIDVNVKEFSSNVISGNSFFGGDDTFINPRRVDHAIRIFADKSLANSITGNSFAYHNDSAIELISPSYGINITGNTSVGDFTLVESHKKSTGVIAFNTSQGDILDGGVKLDIHGNVVYYEPVDPLTGMPINTTQRYFVGIPKNYKKKYVTKISNFNLDTDVIALNSKSFGIDDDPTISFAKNKKKFKKYIKKDVDFIYNDQTGRLYYNENGSDSKFGDGGIISIFLDKPNLSITNIEFF